MSIADVFDKLSNELVLIDFNGLQKKTFFEANYEAESVKWKKKIMKFIWGG